MNSLFGHYHNYTVILMLMIVCSGIYDCWVKRFFFFVAINNLKKFFTAFGLILLSWISTLVTVLIVAVFISLVGRSLSWYTHFYVSVFLYGTAAVVKLILVHSLAKKFYYKVRLTSLPLLKSVSVVFHLTWALGCCVKWELAAPWFRASSSLMIGSSWFRGKKSKAF